MTPEDCFAPPIYEMRGPIRTVHMATLKTKLDQISWASLLLTYCSPITTDLDSFQTMISFFWPQDLCLCFCFFLLWFFFLSSALLWYTLYTVASQGELVVENSPTNAGDIRDARLIPGLGRSPGEDCGNPLPYSCLENPMDRLTNFRHTVS